ncbi:aminotransferase class III-fold pyridoxal phosphate-dependent enzyme [Henriciella sp.]|uniref:class-III pyridoxal-phosphate-dependent aminotransferase n=1 Tax=Henriciella sp. TaxID=1968823 RepID=UPI00261E043E|nr:aminotransferase class III-fold pyridoxal phosphate-dependent enzyme [Henriciella sp.]
MTSRDETIQLHETYLSKHKLPLFRQFGWEVVEGRREGVFFWDLDGKRYFDCHVCGGVYNLGHRNPKVIKAVSDALGHLDLGNHHLVSTERSALARKLVESAGETSSGERMGRVVFSSGGGEAMDFAFKMAKGYTGKSKILCLEGGYHGHTGLSMGAGDEKYTEAWNYKPEGFAKVSLEDLDQIEKFFDEDTAAVSLETIPATLGMNVIPRSTMQHIRKVTREHGILLILDEIQTGCGRSGRTWAFQHYDIMPDIFATGKGFSGGIYPIAATVYRDEMERVYEENPMIHFSTFGGSEIGCAAADVVIEHATDPDFLAHVNALSDYFRTAIKDLAERSNKVSGLRQVGMFQAIEFVDVATCISAVARLNTNGVFCVFSNNDRVCAQFMPPLIMTLDEAEELMGLVRQSVEEAEAQDLSSSSFFSTQTEARVLRANRAL